MIRLWSINRILRWTGFRLIVNVDDRSGDDPDRRPTLIGFVWVGLYGSAGWKRWIPVPMLERAESTIRTEVDP